MTEPIVTHPYKSRPEIAVPDLNITVLDKAGVAPGYLFLAPFKNEVGGPLIYDQFGELVWSGSDGYFATSGSGPHTYGFEPCPYSQDGDDGDSYYLCMLHAFNPGGSGRGQGLILDSRYRIVKTVLYNGTSSALDLHEFQLVAGGLGQDPSALLTQYVPIQADLESFGVSGIGWLHDSVFQEQRLSDGSIVFEWRASEHVELDETAIRFYDGEIPGLPWDYFHINSIQKLSDSGDYIISARHTSAIYRISGKDGSIIWSLGGRRSDFRMVAPSGGGKDTEQDDWFFYPHHATLIRNDSGILTVSVFDNGQTPLRKPRTWSRGLLLSVDEAAHTASILGQYHSATEPRAAELAGSTQVLENGNVLVGWGNTGCVTEYSSESEARPVFEACVHDGGSQTPALYRAHKSTAWRGFPETRPAVASFSLGGRSAKTAVHMSWNGATEVASWRVCGSKDYKGRAKSSHGAALESWEDVGTYPRSGFETSALVDTQLWPFVRVEALSAQGVVLGRSSPAKTFVPSKVRPECDEMWCEPKLAVPSSPPRQKGKLVKDQHHESSKGVIEGRVLREIDLSKQIGAFALLALLLLILVRSRLLRLG